MILVDTSVWVDHLRRGDDRLSGLLEEGEVVCHPFIAGELACGHLRNRAEILSLLAELPHATVAHHDEVLELIESRGLHGKGLGGIDSHLLASALLSHCSLWTRDRALARAARSLGVGRA
jgi:predicted nucleic acid-binding protein